jgi:hypothetical protein
MIGTRYIDRTEEGMIGLMEKLSTPWTKEQITRLNAFQEAGKMHPFTCPNRGDNWHKSSWVNGVEGDVGQLVAGPDGWYCPWCDYTQNWAHDFMADGTWE